MSNVHTNATQQAVYEDISDAADAILNRWSDGEDLSDDEELEAADENLEETSEDTSDTFEDEDQEVDDEDTDEDPDTDDDTEEEDERQADEEDDETEVELSDDALVEIQIDGEVKQASLKDLKRLYGQEASLTRKSQEVAAKRKEAEEALGKAHTSYQTLLKRAEDRFKPYSELDMILASRQMSTEDFAALRKEAQDAESDLKFLREEADAFYRDAQAQQQQAVQEAAQNCIKVLSEQLPEWGNELYNDIRTYAVSQGLPQEQVDQYVDPAVIMILNKARLYDQTKASAQSKKDKAKVIKSKDGPKLVLKSKKAPANESDMKRVQQKKAREALRQSQDRDDIASALLARWER